MKTLMAATLLCLFATALSAQTAAPSFILLLHEDATFKNLPDKQAQIKEYTDWAGQLGKAGQLVDAGKLKDDGMIITAKTQRKATPKELPVTGTGVAGYFVIRAADYDAAVKIAMTCPHVKYNGTIVVRQLEGGK